MENLILLSYKDIKPGIKINYLTIVQETFPKEKPSGQKERMFTCICDCGNKVNIRLFSLSHGLTKSCGCKQRELVRKSNTKHGMSYTKFRGIHNAMKQRCNNPNHKDYKYYGGRGISYCEKWRSFQGFIEDMFGTYRDGLTIERENPDLGYFKENCKWVPMPEQSKNRRNTIRFIYQGKLTTLKDICKTININYSTVWERLFKQNLDLNQAISLRR